MLTFFLPKIRCSPKKKKKKKKKGLHRYWFWFFGHNFTLTQVYDFCRVRKTIYEMNYWGGWSINYWGGWLGMHPPLKNYWGGCIPPGIYAPGRLCCIRRAMKKDFQKSIKLGASKTYFDFWNIVEPVRCWRNLLRWRWHQQKSETSAIEFVSKAAKFLLTLKPCTNPFAEIYF